MERDVCVDVTCPSKKLRGGACKAKKNSFNDPWESAVGQVVDFVCSLCN